jgi:nitrogen fixation/metabolism regulation signal transduction histidine kinase
VRGAALPRAAGDARLLVFDDITEVVSAQRSAAWAEVARRLAHEIKNPLTPIQLSAERLQHKLVAKLEGSRPALLLTARWPPSSSQVQAMKKLVNEFRDYARLPAAQMQPLDLNALVAEVLGCTATRRSNGVLRPSWSRPAAHQGDATQLRQVIHNLVQNALDAVRTARRPGGGEHRKRAPNTASCAPCG